MRARSNLLRSWVERCGLVWGLVALAISVTMYVRLVWAGLGSVHGWGRLLLVAAIVQAVNLSLAATPLGCRWQPVLAVTRERVAAARWLLVAGLLLVAYHGAWWLVGRGDRVDEVDFFRASLCFASAGVVTSLVLISHWALSSEAVLPEVVRDLARPWRFFLGRFRRERARRRTGGMPE